LRGKMPRRARKMRALPNRGPEVRECATPKRTLNEALPMKPERFRGEARLSNISGPVMLSEAKHLWSKFR
jgi:hypothetical protein